MKSKILENIRSIRKSQKKTQAEMAGEMGMSLTAYGNFERGKTKLTQDRIDVFANVLGKTPSCVVNGYETVEGEAANLEEYRVREVRFRDLLDQANGRIDSLEKDLEKANRQILSQEHEISLLEDIRKMLEKQLESV